MNIIIRDSSHTFYRRFGFQFFKVQSEHLKIRKDIIRDNRSIKKKLQKYSLSYNERIQDTIMNNKKKSIFALVMLGVLQYYNIYFYLYRKIRNAEPLENKLRRWILGEKNLPGPTILEQKFNSTLKPDTQEKLEKLFGFLESKFEFGVNRRYLYTIYNDLHLFNKKEEGAMFYRQSGYYKSRNQKLSAVHCGQFIALFEDALNKLKQKDKNITEDQLLERFIDISMDKIQENKEWIQKIQSKREEYKKIVPFIADKKNIEITQILIKNPYATLSEIDQEIKDKGYIGLSIKDEIIINFKQMKLHEAILDSYKLKLQKQCFRNFGTSKLTKQKQKIQNMEAKVKEYQLRQQQLTEKFQKTFKKQELFPLQYLQR